MRKYYANVSREILQIDNATRFKLIYESSKSLVTQHRPRRKKCLGQKKSVRETERERKSKSEHVFKTKIYEVFMSMNYHSFSL